MKATIASWIWIAGSIVIATIIILFSMTMMLNFQENTKRTSSIEEYNDILSRASIICSQSKGNIVFKKISIPDIVRAIYPANYINELPPDKVSVNITNLNKAKGKYICMQFFDENVPRCSKIDCELEMTYIGSPTLQNNLQDMLAKLGGKFPMYTYNMMLNKTGTNKLSIIAEREINI